MEEKTVVVVLTMTPNECRLVYTNTGANTICLEGRSLGRGSCVGHLPNVAEDVYLHTAELGNASRTVHYRILGGLFYILHAVSHYV